MICFSASRPGLRRIRRRSWNGLRYAVSLSFETPRCGESHRRVALACVHVCVSINVLAVTVNYCFSVETLVIVERVVGPKSVSIDGQRLLLVIIEKESHCRFVGGFRRDNVSMTAAAITEREHWRFIPLIRSSSAFREATRARLSVALAAFLSGRDVELVDLDWANEIDRWRVEQFARTARGAGEASDTKRQFQCLTGGYSC